MNKCGSSLLETPSFSSNRTLWLLQTVELLETIFKHISFKYAGTMGDKSRHKRTHMNTWMFLDVSLFLFYLKFGYKIIWSGKSLTFHAFLSLDTKYKISFDIRMWDFFSWIPPHTQSQQRSETCDKDLLTSSGCYTCCRVTGSLKQQLLQLNPNTHLWRTAVGSCWSKSFILSVVPGVVEY